MFLFIEFPLSVVVSRQSDVLFTLLKHSTRCIFSSLKKAPSLLVRDDQCVVIERVDDEKRQAQDTSPL